MRRLAVLLALCPAVLAGQTRPASSTAPCMNIATGVPANLPAAVPLPWGQGRLSELPAAARREALARDADYWRAILPPCPGVTGAIPRSSMRPAPSGLQEVLPEGARAARLLSGTRPVGRDGLLPPPRPEEIPGHGLPYCTSGTSRLTTAANFMRQRLGMARNAGVRDAGTPLTRGMSLLQPECLTTTISSPPLVGGGRGLLALGETGRAITPKDFDPYRYPQVAVPPAIGGTFGPLPRASALPPLLPHWDTPCSDALRRYDRWFAGLGAPRTPKSTGGAWLSHWGGLAFAQWRMDCEGGRVTSVTATLRPIDGRAEGVTETAMSVRRWVARVFPPTTIMHTTSGDPQGHTPSITTYFTNGPLSRTHPVLRLITSGTTPEVVLQWTRDPAGHLP